MERFIEIKTEKGDYRNQKEILVSSNVEVEIIREKSEGELEIRVFKKYHLRYEQI